MREKAERLSRSAELWERGAEGERTTARVLDRLPSTEWTVFHDVRWPGRRLANVDHVVIGPPGVFVIDSKNWSGSIEIRGDVLRQNGRSRERAVANAADAGLAVAGMTDVVSSDHVFPVLCFVRDEPITGRARNVMVCTTSNLEEMLLTRPRRIDAVTRRRLRLDIDASLRSAASMAESVERPARQNRPQARSSAATVQPRTTRQSSPLPTRNERSGGRSGRSASRRLLTMLAAATLVVLALMSPLPSMVGTWFTSLVTGAVADGQSKGAEGEVSEETKRRLVGTWKGAYSCSVTPTPARLVIRQNADGGSLLATLTFEARTPEGETVRGRFRLSVDETADAITFAPSAWVQQPVGYSMIELRATHGTDDTRLEGRVTNPGCTTFAFVRVS